MWKRFVVWINDRQCCVEINLHIQWFQFHICRQQIKLKQTQSMVKTCWYACYFMMLESDQL